MNDTDKYQIIPAERKDDSAKRLTIALGLALLLAALGVILSIASLIMVKQTTKDCNDAIASLEMKFQLRMVNFPQRMDVSEGLSSNSSAPLTKTTKQPQILTTPQPQIAPQVQQKSSNPINAQLQRCTTNGSLCVFPFIYRGVTYNDCTMVNHDRLWCGLSSNYDIIPKWENCVDCHGSNADDAADVSGFCEGGLYYKNTCIWLPYVAGEFVSFDYALRICSGRLLEITDEPTYNVVYNYIKYYWSYQVTWGRGPFHGWLGSSYTYANNPNHVVNLSNGSDIILPSLMWQPATPTFYTGHTRMSLVVRINDDSIHKGISNRPDDEKFVPICVRNVPQ
ncbi:uncharacterized protein LOC143449552 [Clavelina lepadiformis]|uniref:uncharacterized protein LOC143449552 n=1 Tax=Clavelina lepadiformis TaxID=159417 RepID=UPI0040425D2D